MRGLGDRTLDRWFSVTIWILIVRFCTRGLRAHHFALVPIVSDLVPTILEWRALVVRGGPVKAGPGAEPWEGALVFAYQKTAE